jgi:hypothetical protein
MMPRYLQVSSAASGSDFFSKETLASRRTHHHFILGPKLFQKSQKHSHFNATTFLKLPH